MFIGHAGHDEPPPYFENKVPDVKGNEDKYCLDAQVRHKVRITLHGIKKFLQLKKKIILLCFFRLNLYENMSHLMLRST